MIWAKLRLARSDRAVTPVASRSTCRRDGLRDRQFAVITGPSTARSCRKTEMHAAETDLGDIIVALLGGIIAGLADKLEATGFVAAAEVMTDLTEITDDYLMRLPVP